MVTLFLSGTLLDDITDIAMAFWTHNTPMLFVFLVYVLLSSFTVLNMLIGVLCEVVTAVSEQSQEETKIEFVRLAADVQMKILVLSS